VEYEDYALRLLYGMGFPSPEPYGVVEITPEREYMILMEFFDGAVEISDAEVTSQVIDEGLALIRKMWDAGLAHRDVKPANLMVQDGHLKLIDVFFVQVRPSPWRQAVDLANMMLVLALRSDAPTVYERSLAYFTPDEIAEAFAATRGVASPTQLRTHLKEDQRDLVSGFRSLAPHRDPVRIQRWSVRRILLTSWVALLLVLALGLVASNWAVFT
jgi:tRNA A-37 threonylcarbamoyl transferase component Bud32